MDMFEREWRDILPHIEDDLRSRQMTIQEEEVTGQKVHAALNQVVDENPHLQSVFQPSAWDSLSPHDRAIYQRTARDLNEVVAIKQAWDELQAIPSYVEQMAQAFAAETGLEIA